VELNGRAVSVLSVWTWKLSHDRRDQSLDGWTRIYYLELLRASEGTLSCWPRLHLQSLAPTPVLRRVDVRQAAGRKNNCRIFITTWWKHVVPLSGIRVGRRRFWYDTICQYSLNLQRWQWRLKIITTLPIAYYFLRDLSFSLLYEASQKGSTITFYLFMKKLLFRTSLIYISLFYTSVA
jgi:hypothetical protein